MRNKFNLGEHTENIIFRFFKTMNIIEVTCSVIKYIIFIHQTN
jgi:hypothetical protein